MKATMYLLGSLVVSNVLAIEYDDLEYKRLLEEANEKSIVPIMISLDNTLSLTEISSNRALIKQEMEEKAQSLLTELGADTLKLGYWNNGIGQMGVYLNVDNLRILASSRNAMRFERDTSRIARLRAFNNDRSLDSIEETITKKGFANVEVFLNVDALSYDIGKDGKTIYHPSPELSAQIEQSIDNIKDQAFSQQIKSLNRSVLLKPSFHARIDRISFYGLRDNTNVRAIRPLGYVDTRLASWPEEVLEIAERNGEASVLISLRGGGLFNPKTGYMSKKALKVQSAANERAFHDIFKKTKTIDPIKGAKFFNSIGAIHAQLQYQTLLQLYENADPRILQIKLNKATYKTQLSNSTGLINMQSAWNAGYVATGQNIIIIDTGIRKNHDMFMVNGVSKVVFEACFGTNFIIIQSICPNQDSFGDSPLGFPNSGEPSYDSVQCSELNSKCTHGTHVAGIAAGSSSTYQGVAIGANLISIQVSSYGSSNGVGISQIFDADIIAALQAIQSGTIDNTNNNPYVINMSLGGGSYSEDCNHDQVYVNLIAELSSRGVPVVVSTGNDSFSDSIEAPACFPHTIKVSSVINDASGTNLSSFANIANPNNFTGPILLAPGGGIYSANSDGTFTNNYTKKSGTSMAAPHVAGFYATIKAAVPGVSVNDASAWIRDVASIPVNVGSHTYRRIKMPSL